MLTNKLYIAISYSDEHESSMAILSISAVRYVDDTPVAAVHRKPTISTGPKFVNYPCLFITLVTTTTT